MLGANDNAGLGGAGPYRASTRALLIPTLVVALLYGLPLAGLVASGAGDGAVARLCIVALSVMLPFLIAHAVLRRVTARVDAMPHALVLRPGFPSMREHVVPYPAIRSVSVRRGLGGRLARSATLSVELAGGARRTVADLADATAARDAIMERMTVAEGVGARPSGAEIAAATRRVAI